MSFKLEFNSGWGTPQFFRDNTEHAKRITRIVFLKGPDCEYFPDAGLDEVCAQFEGSIDWHVIPSNYEHDYKPDYPIGPFPTLAQAARYIYTTWRMK